TPITFAFASSPAAPEDPLPAIPSRALAPAEARVLGTGFACRVIVVPGRLAQHLGSFSALLLYLHAPPSFPTQSPSLDGRGEGWRNADSILLVCSHSMSCCERASQSLGRHMCRCVAVVGMPRRGVLVQG